MGIHKFTNATQPEAKTSKDLDAIRFAEQFQNILILLANPEIKESLSENEFFQKHPFSNQFDFMTVLVVYFVEAPADLKQNFPKIYSHIKKMLNFNFVGY